MLFVLLRIKLKYLNFINIKIWKVVGVVERGRFEICWTSNCSGGSNPSLSAIFFKLMQVCEGFCADIICTDILCREPQVVGISSTNVATRQIWLSPHWQTFTFHKKTNCTNNKIRKFVLFYLAIAFVFRLNMIN